MEPQNQNPYDFIVNPNGPQHGKSPGINFSSGKNKILIYAVFGLVAIILLIIGISVISSLGKTNNQDLVEVDAQQTEIVRIIELGQKDARSADVLNQLATLNVLISSDKSAVESLLTKRSVKPDKNALASAKNSDTDSALDKAKQIGNYDDVLIQQISKQSNEYYQSLKTALSDASTNAEKNLLNTAISNIQLFAKNISVNSN